MTKRGAERERGGIREGRKEWRKKDMYVEDRFYITGNLPTIKQ
jgi:hypothetical protein